MSIPGTIVREGSLITPGGDQGVPGAPSKVPGPPGENAFTLSSQDFTVPDIGLSADLTVEDSDWIAVGQMIYLANGAGPEEAQALKVTAKNGNVVTVWHPEPPGMAEIPLADSTEDGLMRRVSGLTTDFVDGTNNSRDLVTAITPTVNRYLPLTGGALTGNLAMSNKDITGIANLTTTNATANKLTCPSLFFRSDGWRLVFDGATGNLVYYDASNNVKFHWYAGGNEFRVDNGGLYTGRQIYCRDYIQAVGFLESGAPSGTGYVYCGSINWCRSGWKLQFSSSNGDLIYYRYDGVWLLWFDNAGWYFRVKSNIQCDGQIYAYTTLKASGGSGLITAYGGEHGMVFHWNGAGVYVMVDAATGWMVITDPSDERLKEDITPSTFDCLGTILQLPIHQFRWKPTKRSDDNPVRDLGDKRTRMQAKDGRAPMIPVGFVAQRLYEVFPEAVKKGDDGEGDPQQRFNWDIDKTTMLATLTGAIQQLSAKVESLEARVAELEGSPA